MSEPTLGLILRHACELYGCSVSQSRCLNTDEAIRSRAAYLWLTRELTTHSEAAAGLYVGLGQADAVSAAASVAEAIAADPAVREIFEEAAVEIITEARVRHRIGRAHQDKSPLDIARQIVAGGASAMTVGATHLAHLASAYVALTSEVALLREQLSTSKRRSAPPGQNDPRVKALVAAATAFNQAVFTPGERAARVDLDQAVTALSNPEASHAH